MLSKIPKEFIVSRQGKDFVLYAGLLNEAHKQGLKSIRTALVQAPCKENGNMAICHATVETSAGVFSGIGDASPDNVTKMIAAHAIRMAETRAKARALRDALNIGGTAFEELGDEEEEKREQKQVPPRQEQQKPAQQQRPAAGVDTPAPATKEQYAELTALGEKLFNDFGKDLGEHITEDLSMAQADILLSKFNVTYRKLAATAASPLAPPTSIAAKRQAVAADVVKPERIKTLHNLQTKLGLPLTDVAGDPAASVEAAITELAKALNAQTKKASTR